MEEKRVKKHLIKFKFYGKHRQKTIKATDIYEAEKELRKMLMISEYSDVLFVKTIKCGRTEYQVFGSVLGG